MNPSRFHIEKTLTSSNDVYLYEIVDKDGTIYATTYDSAVAEIIKKALQQHY